MRIEFLCISVLRIASGPSMKLASCTSASPPTPPPPPTHTPQWLTLLTILRRCVSLTLLLCGLFYEAICLCLTLCYFVLVFFSPLALRLPRFGKRELILVLFVRLFDLCLFGFVSFLFLLVSGKGCGL